MREPWRKYGGWPYEGRRGKSWQLGYRDHEGRVRSRSFRARTAAETWAREYVEAERRNRLRDFLLGSDAPEVRPDGTPLGELIRDWLATDAHPDSVGGLARNSWDTYRSIASRHIVGNAVEQHLRKSDEVVELAPAIKPLGQPGGYAIGHLPVIEFGSADILKRWVQGMRAAGVSRATEAKAWTVISSALSWAVEDERWPLSMNGCLTMQRRRGMRRASRRAGTGAQRQLSLTPRRDDLPAWALSPIAVERIRIVMLERVRQRSPLLALRDATAISVQYGLGMRNQEIWALSIGDVASRRATVREVLSYGTLDAGKTEGATGRSRRPPIDAVLADDLAQWKVALAAAGRAIAPEEFLLRGDLNGHGTPDGHMTGSQAHAWPRRYFSPAVRTVAEQWPDEHAAIVGATPYSLRRGMISLRIRAGEDRQTIAKQCGTSVEMLERSYSFAIEDLEDEGPRPAADERIRARERAPAGRAGFHGAKASHA
jgi:integrase